MSKTEAKKHEAPFSLIPFDGQSADAGLCVDGICALPEPAAKASDSDASARKGEQET